MVSRLSAHLKIVEKENEREIRDDKRFDLLSISRSDNGESIS